MPEFKLIVAGGRDFADYERLSLVLYCLADHALADKEVAIVSGMARGADKLAHTFAKENNIQCYEFPAHWEKYGKSAGYVRNNEMAKASDGLVAFWDGVSKGTKNMIETMQKANKWVHVVEY